MKKMAAENLALSPQEYLENVHIFAYKTVCICVFVNCNYISHFYCFTVFRSNKYMQFRNSHCKKIFSWFV